MTTGWLLFGVVLPAIVAGLGWVSVFALQWQLRREAAKRADPAE